MFGYEELIAQPSVAPRADTEYPSTSRYFHYRIEEHRVPGDHREYIRDHVKAVAECFKACLDA
jgi:hypothetical protein